MGVELPLCTVIIVVTLSQNAISCFLKSADFVDIFKISLDLSIYQTILVGVELPLCIVITQF